MVSWRATARWFAFSLAAWAAGGEEIVIGPRVAAPEDVEAGRARIHELSAGLRQPDLAKLRASADALAATGSPLAVAHLWCLYNPGDAARRSIALEALGRLKAPGQDERLFQVSLSEPFVGLRRTAAEALVRTAGREAAAKMYLKALDDKTALTPLGRLRAVQLLAHVGGAGTGAALKKFITDPDADVASAACEALAVLGENSCVPELVALLPAKNPEVVPTALEALERLTGQKHRYDLIKWEQFVTDWRQTRAAGRAAPISPSVGDYQPDYGDPYALPVEQAAVDFVLVFDTTGSLAKLWPQVCAPIDAVLAEMVKRTPALRLGAVRYRADNPARTLTYLIQPKPLTRDTQAVRDFIQDASFGGGSGGLHLGMLHAISSFNWRAYARRAMLVVGDITPAGNGLERALRVMREGWEQDRIHFNCLYIRSMHGEEHRPTYALLAAAGAGRFYEYDRAWSHLVDLTAEKVDHKTPEPPAETLQKWLKPFPRPLLPPPKGSD